MVTLDAFLDGTRTTGSADISFTDTERKITGLNLQAGGARLTGDVTQDRDELLTGTLELDAADLETVGALLLREMQGSAQARLELAPRNDEQWAQIEARIAKFAARRNTFGISDHRRRDQ